MSFLSCTWRRDATASLDNKKAKFDVMGACMKLVTIHGRPLSLIDDEAFRSIVAMTPQKEIIYAHKVRDRIRAESDIIRQSIQEEIKGKLISLKVDAATCMGRSFLGLNIQFIKAKKYISGQ